MAQLLVNPTGIHEDTALIPGLAQWVLRICVALSCDVGHGLAQIPQCCGVGWQLLLWLDP